MVTTKRFRGTRLLWFPILIMFSIFGTDLEVLGIDTLSRSFWHIQFTSIMLVVGRRLRSFFGARFFRLQQALLVLMSFCRP